MENEDRFYLVKKKAVPDVLLAVVEAKRLLESGKAATIQDATEAVGISRSSFYKYKDDILPFHDDARGKTITMMMQLDDEPGLLSRVTNQISLHHTNILTIHQSIPVGGIAMLTVSLEIAPDGHITELMDAIEGLTGVHALKVLARE